MDGAKNSRLAYADMMKGIAILGMVIFHLLAPSSVRTVVSHIGDSLLAVGDEELIKIHYHTNEPWKVLEYCRTLGEIYDIVVEDMDRQARGLQG